MTRNRKIWLDKIESAVQVRRGVWGEESDGFEIGGSEKAVRGRRVVSSR